MFLSIHGFPAQPVGPAGTITNVALSDLFLGPCSAFETFEPDGPQWRQVDLGRSRFGFDGVSDHGGGSPFAEIGSPGGGIGRDRIRSLGRDKIPGFGLQKISW